MNMRGIKSGAEPVRVTSIDHLAIVVPDLEQAIEFFEDNFGARASEPVVNAGQGVRIAYAHFARMKIELLQPQTEASPAGRFLAKHPWGGLHHVCFTTGDGAAAHQAAEARGLRPLHELQQGHHGRPLFFLHPGSTLGTLIEIEEAPANADTD